MEVFPLCAATLEPLGLAACEGHEGLTPAGVLEAVAEQEGSAATLVQDGSVTYGLRHSSGLSFTLEPGGQIEVATPPRETLAEVSSDLVAAFGLLERAAVGRVKFLSHGTHPLSSDEFPLLVPKTRYRILTRYLQSEEQGRGIHMMRHTATVQPNLDVGPLASDWRDAVRLTYALSPLFKGFFRNSFYFQGKLSPDGLERQRIWEGMDHTRTGVPTDLETAENPACGYVAWAEQAYVFHIDSLPEAEQPQFGELRFQEWLERGYKGTHPTLADWEAHLNTLFPDLRLRGFLELRMFDSQPFDRVMPLMALNRGLLQSRAGRRAAWKVVETFRSQARGLPGESDRELWNALLAAAAEGLREFEDSFGLRLLDLLEPAGEHSGVLMGDAKRFVKLHATRWPSALVQSLSSESSSFVRADI